MFEFITSTGQRLSLVDDFKPIESNEKIVYKATDGSKLYAARIFREHYASDGTEFIDTPHQRVKREKLAYDALFKTPFQPYMSRIYIPLVNKRRLNVGSITEWEDGPMLEEHLGEKVVRKIEIDRLFSSVLFAIDMGYLPDTDMLRPYNIGMSESRKPRLWFTEYGLETDRFNLGGVVYEAWFQEVIEELYSFAE